MEHDGSGIGLSEEDTILRNTVRKFCEEEVLPGELTRDENRDFPAPLIQELAEQGILGLLVPEEHGGVGMTALQMVLAIEEIARTSGSLAMTVATHVGLATMGLVDRGSEEFRAAHVPDLASGEKLGGCALSPSGTLSARAEGDGFVLDGEASWVANAGHAGVLLVPAQIDGESPAAWFGVPADTAGVSVGSPEDKLGLHSFDVRAVTFQSCAVESNQRLDSSQEPVTENRAKVVFSAVSLGLAQDALERAARFASERQTFGVPIAKHEAIATKLGDMAIRLQSARHLVYHAAKCADAGQPFSVEAAMAKTSASEAGVSVGFDAVQVLGGYGYTREYHVERAYRDAKLLPLALGANEQQRVSIAEQLLMSYGVQA